MTLLPAPVKNDLHYILGAKGEPVPPAFLCAHPACMERAQERHHLFRRSELKGAYDWVEVIEASGQSVKVPNVADLCRRHHADVTENRAWIKLEGTVYVWTDRLPDGGWRIVGALSRDVDESVYCPSCGQPKRLHRDPLPRLATRRKKSWVIAVPDDAEDGAEALQTLVDWICEELGYDGPKGLARYHAMSAAAVFTLQNKELFLKERR